MRARLIDADGVSHITNIPDGCGPIFRRYVPDDPEFGLVASKPPDNLLVRIETFVREVWFVPVGPLVAPIGDPGEQLDALYRYESTSP
jgi:hypothetical protein